MAKPEEGHRGRRPDYGRYYDDLWLKKGGKLKDEEVFRSKTRLLDAMVPEGIRTIIDLGCGDGSITNALAEKWDVVGVDSSAVAVSHLSPRAKGIVSSAAQVPFADRSFDLVLSSELLEHLGNDILGRVVHEIDRLARTHILLSVPNGERLRKRFTKCASCGAVYHIYGHLQSFDLRSLGKLFPHFEMKSHAACGTPEAPSFNVISLAANVFARRYFQIGSIPLVCPYCGAELKPISRNLPLRIIGRTLSLVERALTAFCGRTARPDWLIVLLQRRETGKNQSTEEGV